MKRRLTVTMFMFLTAAILSVSPWDLGVRADAYVRVDAYVRAYWEGLSAYQSRILTVDNLGEKPQVCTNGVRWVGVTHFYVPESVGSFRCRAF